MAEAKDQCGSCKQKVNSKEKAVECEICQLWYHTRCEKINDGTYKILQEDNGIHWYCEGCNKGIAKVLLALANLQKRQDKVEETLDTVRNDFKILKEDMEKRHEELERKVSLKYEKEDEVKLTKEIEELTKSYLHDGLWSDVVKQEISKNISGLDSKVVDLERSVEDEKQKLDHEREKFKKRDNVILYNMPENLELGHWSHQQKEDESFVVELMSFLLDDDFELREIKKLTRLGRRNFLTADKPESIPLRPVLIEFCNGTTKNAVMQSLSRLKRAEDKFRKIIISHDMTKLERHECKQLVLQAKEMELQDQSGEYIYRVRGLPGKMKVVKWRRRMD